MATSRYDYVANQGFLDSHVPLPFEHMKQAINQKQGEYDNYANALDKASLLKLDIDPTVKDAYGNVIGDNPDYIKHKQVDNQFRNELDAIKEKHGYDYTDPKAKREIGQLLGKVNNYYSTHGKLFEDSSKELRNQYKKAQEYKGPDWQHNAVQANDRLHNFVKSGGSLGEGLFTPGNIGEYTDTTEQVNKHLSNLKADERVKQLSLSPSDGGLSETKRKSTIEEVTKNKVLPLFEAHRSELLPRWQDEIRDKIRAYPEKYYNEDGKPKVVKEGGKTITLAEKELNDKNKNLWGEYSKAIFSKTDADISKHYLPEYLGKAKKEEMENIQELVQNPVSNIEQDYIDPNKIGSSINFVDYMKTSGWEPNPEGFTNSEGKFIKGITTAKDILSGNLTSADPNYKKEFEKYKLFKDNKLSDKAWTEEFSKINPLAKVLTEKNPNISKKELVNTYNELSNQKNIYSYSKRLDTENKEALKQNLIGNRKDLNFQGYINNTSLMDEQGNQYNFENIPLPDKSGFFKGTPTIGEVLKKGDSKELQELYKSIDVGTDIVGGKSIGGNYIKIGGRKYMTGGVTPTQKTILAPYNILNEPIKNITKGQTESQPLPVTNDIILSGLLDRGYNIKDLKNIVAKNEINLKHPNETPVISFYKNVNGKLEKIPNVQLDYKDYLEATQEMYDNNSKYITTKKDEDKGNFPVNEDLE